MRARDDDRAQSTDRAPAAPSPANVSVRERLRKLAGATASCDKTAQSSESADAAATKCAGLPAPARRAEALVLVAGADPSCWSRVREGLQGLFAVAFAPDLSGTLEVLQQHRPAVLVLWSRLLDADFEKAARCLRCRSRKTAVVVVGRQEEKSAAVKRLRADAQLSEGEVEGSLLPLVRGLLEQQSRLRAADLTQAGLSEHPERALEELPAFRQLVVGKSKAFREVLETAYRVAAANVTVLIYGESGTGKELMARWIHCMSPRARAPFESADLPAIPDELFESILFGHERGAFTGAVTPTVGKFQKAEGGTLFLDEVSNLRLHLQPKLLRVLQERQVESVGGRGPVATDVRVIAATNVDLAQAVERGEFRADLFYRLNIVALRLPPLRERREDISELVDFMVDKYAKRFNRTRPAIHEDALTALRAHHWPGNIRELENRVQTAVLMGDGTLGAEDFFGEHERPAAGEVAEPRFGDADCSLEDIQRMYVRWVLDQTEGNQSQAAQILRIDRKTLRAKLQRPDQPARGPLGLVAGQAC